MKMKGSGKLRAFAAAVTLSAAVAVSANAATSDSIQMPDAAPSNANAVVSEIGNIKTTLDNFVPDGQGHLFKAQAGETEQTAEPTTTEEPTAETEPQETEEQSSSPLSTIAETGIGGVIGAVPGAFNGAVSADSTAVFLEILQEMPLVHSMAEFSAQSMVLS